MERQDSRGEQGGTENVVMSGSMCVGCLPECVCTYSMRGKGQGKNKDCAAKLQDTFHKNRLILDNTWD